MSNRITTYRSDSIMSVCGLTLDLYFMITIEWCIKLSDICPQYKSLRDERREQLNLILKWM